MNKPSRLSTMRKMFGNMASKISSRFKRRPRNNTKKVSNLHQRVIQKYETKMATKKAYNIEKKLCVKLLEEDTKKTLENNDVKPIPISINYEIDPPEDLETAWKNIGELFKGLKYDTIYKRFFRTH